MLQSMTCKTAYLPTASLIFFLLFCRATTEEVNHSNTNSPQKSSGGFKLFQSNHNGPSQQVSPPQNGSMSPGTNNAPSTQAPPNGILKNSYDRDAMSRVGQR